jgi:HPt (histidine-containing phosphotransfer) domain-containing protein
MRERSQQNACCIPKLQALTSSSSGFRAADGNGRQLLEARLAQVTTMEGDTEISPASPVDLAHLSRYTQGEASLEREVLKLFLHQSPVYLERLRQASSGRDWQDAAHALKGVARAIGAWHLADTAEHAEKLSGPAFAEGKAESLRDIEAALHAAEAFIQTRL